MRAACTLAGLILCAACATGNANQLLPLAESIASARTLTVLEADCAAPSFVEEMIVGSLQGCSPPMQVASDGHADLEITWLEPDCAICLDSWAHECDQRRLQVHIKPRNSDSLTWSGKRPIWCTTADCVTSLFLRDLKAIRCHDN